MNDNASLQVSVPVRVRSVPEVHPAATILTIRRRHEVGIVITAAILSIGDDGVVLCASTSKVVLLEVTGNFIKTISGEFRYK